MYHRTKFLFIVELALFLLLIWGFNWIWPLSVETIILAGILFSLTWFYSFQRSVMLLEYYTHLFFVALLFAFLLLIISIWVTDGGHIIFVGLSAIASWCSLMLLLRFSVNRWAGQQYRLIYHPDSLEHPLDPPGKFQLLPKRDVTPTDLTTADIIIVNHDFDYPDDWQNLLLHANIHDMPIITTNHMEEHLWQRLPLQDLKRNWLQSGFHVPLWYRWSKTTIEWIITVCLAPLLLLIFALVSTAILLTMGRPIFYTQKRMGFHNRPFTVYKFRTMINDADRLGETQTDDQRITRLGALMRKFRVDELPQFINILKGDMALIGPRPEWVQTAESFTKALPLYPLRHLVKPGITGWAQVNQGHAVGVKGNQEKLQYDLYYVKHFSPILDLKIVVKTIYTILTGFGAK